MGSDFLVLFLILSLHKIYVELDPRFALALARWKKKENKKTLFIKSDLISSMYMGIHDSQWSIVAVRVSGSPLQSQ